jgi:hypothetical protein
MNGNNIMDGKQLLSNVKRRRIKPIVGDYVFAAKFSDADMGDPHSVGFVVSIEDVRGVTYYCVRWGLERFQWRDYKNVWKITGEEGAAILEYSAQYQRSFYSQTVPQPIHQITWAEIQTSSSPMPTNVSL